MARREPGIKVAQPSQKNEDARKQDSTELPVRVKEMEGCSCHALVLFFAGGRTLTPACQYFVPSAPHFSETNAIAVDRSASQDEDLVDDTLDDLPLGTLDDQIEVGVIDVPPPPVDFDDNDGYDDGYDSDPGISGMDSEGMY